MIFSEGNVLLRFVEYDEYAPLFFFGSAMCRYVFSTSLADGAPTRRQQSPSNTFQFCFSFLFSLCPVYSIV